MNNNKIIVDDDLGNKIECVVLLTYNDKENNKSYIVYKDKDGDICASCFNPEDINSDLMPIEDEKVLDDLDHLLNEMKIV